MKTALICGISGQDGAYLARLLLEKGYRVFGTSRDAQAARLFNLSRLGILDRVTVKSVSLTDSHNVLQTVVETAPDELYNLTGQTSVGFSFHQPVETLESIAVATLNLLEAIRFLRKPIRLFSAGSGACFGHTPDAAAREDTAFRPMSPYAIAKAAAFWQVANYRESYDLHGCTGILFNHESPLRSERFVIRKVVGTACRIARGSKEKLRLGSADIERDWGWAPEYVEAMWLMLQQAQPQDYVIATGESSQLGSLVEEAFGCLDLDWRDHIDFDPTLLLPADLAVSRADPSKAQRELGWKAKYRMRDVVRMMVHEERRLQAA